MKTTGRLEEDELAFFALGLLEESEKLRIQAQLSASAEDRSRLAWMQSRLGAYTEAMVSMQGLPDGALDRLMRRVGKEKRVVVFPQPVEAQVKAPPSPLPKETRSVTAPLSWIGWAVAATLALLCGKIFQEQASLRAQLSIQISQIGHMHAQDAEISRERDALKLALAEQSTKTGELTAEAASAQNDRDKLLSAVAGQTAKLKDEDVQVANAQAEVDRMRATVDIQAGQVAQQAAQVAQLAADAIQARQILEALSDRTALRVTLTKPKSRTAPSARATYVGSSGTLVFLANDLARLKNNKVYQIWLMPADGSDPIPEGTFVPDVRGSASLLYAKLPRPASAKGFSITIEDTGGSQVPTLPIVLTGSANL